MASGGESQQRASVLEIVGAWLGVWTPPRDRRVPPVPWRALAIGAALTAAVVAGALAVLVPRIDAGKAERAARDRAERAVRDAAARRESIRRQRPRHASAPDLRPRAGASPAAVQAARDALVVRLQGAILADARARAATGEMRHVAGPARCSPTSGTRTDGPLGAYDCFAITSVIPASERNVEGTIGYPFRAILDFRTFSYTWCRTEQIPGEQSIPDPRKVVALPDACRVPEAARK